MTKTETFNLRAQYIALTTVAGKNDGQRRVHQAGCFNKQRLPLEHFKTAGHEDIGLRRLAIKFFSVSWWVIQGTRLEPVVLREPLGHAH